MKKSAFLINVSRGGIVNENDLYEALKSGEIAAAAEDVLVKEPPEGHPLFSLDNFIGTPHAAWYSEESSLDLKTKLAEEMVRALNGEELKNALN
jgi:D-3-phosphoglycerate dehydrogenase